MSVRTTVLIVDDHAVFRAAARRLLESEGYVVVAEAPDGTSAMDIARELRPDLALVDIYLPDTDGFELASELASLDRPPAVILVSSRDRKELVSSRDRKELELLVQDSAARGFLTKSVLSKEALEEFV